MINNRSRQGGGQLAEDLRQRLRHHGIAMIQPGDDLPVAELDRFLRANAADADAVIMGGGDGTVSRMLKVLMDVGKPVGVLPLGTANDLARTIGLPLDPLSAVDVIAEGLKHPVDVGTVGDEFFLNVASMGLTSMLSRRLQSASKKRFGRWSYWIEGAKVFRERKTFRARIESEGRTFNVKALQIAVGNGRSYGGILIIDEEAELWDDKLHLYCVEPRPFWQLMRQAPGFLMGKLKGREGILTLEGSRFRVETSRPLEISADGEIKATTPTTFGVLPNALEIYVPAQPQRPQPPALS